MHKISGVALALAALAVGGTAEAQARRSGGYEAEVRRTAYGVPHVKARDYAGLGFGIGYASAEDNICDLAERMLTVSGTRSRHFGPGADDANLHSDLHHERLNRSGELERLLNGPRGSVDTPSAEARALVRGFAAGVSRYIRDVGVANLPDRRCRGAAWVREIDEIDYWRSAFAGQSPFQMVGTVEAAPPFAPGRQVAAADTPLDEPAGLGSNAYGLGRERTKGGRGMLLGNPHYPWDGINRFYRMHFTIPGKLNVVGAGLVNSPVIGIGHTQHIAWTHTVSTARRFGYFELKLDPADPTAYLYEGRSTPMTRSDVTVQVKAGDALIPVTRTLYETQFGPVVETGTLPWTSQRAFALRTVPEGLRRVDQYLAIWQARNVRQLRAALALYQSTGFNTTAADSGGEAFFGDMGMMPHVTDAHAERCIVSELGRTQWKDNRVPVLDGSRADCAWGRDRDATAPGVFGAAALPQLFRRDVVSQMNDSHWLTNPERPLTGYPRIFGDEVTARTLRTRLGLKLLEERESGADGLAGRKFDLATLQQVMFNNRHYGAELTRSDLVTLCRETAAANAALAPACAALAGWDGRLDLDSKGAQLFRVFAENGGLRFKVPFDPDPVNTPRQLDVGDPRVLEALVGAVRSQAALGIPFDAPLRAVQTEPRGAERIPIHGGPGTEGIFNVITPVNLQPGLGWTKIRHGSSWIMTVEFTPQGPRSQGVLTYSQSTNPDSPHFADQTRLYSQKGWDDLRFSEAAVVAGTLRTTRLSEGPADCARDGWRRYQNRPFANEAACIASFR